MAAADKRRRVILIGASMACKTTLTQAMMREELRYRKTQTLDIVGGFIIDTPWEYLERGGMRGALSVAAAEARLIVFLQSASAAQSFFPPSFASMFGKPVAGVVTKADIASPEEIAEAKRRLTRAGVGRIFVTSAYTGEGIQEFVDFIDSLD
ncbi:MAG: EutP/PduV family microcompartment system protein [Synergistaceae bacterium]|nr:EutP/PduV family microcompartment system protein [Synergistaceae bacterium]